MAKLKTMSAALVLAACFVLPASAQAGDYRFGYGAPGYAYAPPAFGYGEFVAPYPYYGREYRRADKRAERDFRKHMKREAKAHKKLGRAHEKYQARYGYPYGIEYDLVPYGWEGQYYPYR